VRNFFLAYVEEFIGTEGDIDAVVFDYFFSRTFCGSLAIDASDRKLEAAREQRKNRRLRIYREPCLSLPTMPFRDNFRVADCYRPTGSKMPRIGSEGITSGLPIITGRNPDGLNNRLQTDSFCLLPKHLPDAFRTASGA
jgi:hypothetical protein